MTRQALDLTINGESHQLSVEPHWSLLHVLRRELGMTGTKENCLEAEAVSRALDRHHRGTG